MNKKNHGSEDQEPSIHQWRQLYASAEAFGKLEAWEWMWDSDMFGVENPEDGEIGYCCVLGRNKECFSLNIYLGTEGLGTCLEVQKVGMAAIHQDVVYRQKCLMASFEDRDMVPGPDLKRIKNLGMKFRGRHQWPVLRSHRPGYFPWDVTAQEAEFMTICLDQAGQIAKRFKADPEMLFPKKEGHYFVRVPKRNNGKLEWRDDWRKPLPFKKILVVKGSVDKNRINQIMKKASFQKKMIWEIDYFHAPMPVRDGEERPYFPIAILMVDKESLFVLNCHLTNMKKYHLELAQQLLRAFENSGVVPGKIYVRRQEILPCFAPVADELGVEMIVTDQLDAVDEAREGMKEFFVEQDRM